MTTFRAADKNDSELIASLAAEIWRKHYVTIISAEQIEYMLKKMYSREALAEQMENGHEFTIVYDGEEPIGYISISTADKKHYNLHKFYINTDKQRSGIGTILLNHILKKISGAESIRLTVNRKNFKAVNFYFRNQFKIVDVADFDIGNGYEMNDFVMERTANL